ncbi:MAG TPA: hypothetical protein VF043_35905 [Ktedonobacteraceae bacterium]
MAVPLGEALGESTPAVRTTITDIDYHNSRMSIEAIEQDAIRKGVRRCVSRGERPEPSATSDVLPIPPMPQTVTTRPGFRSASECVPLPDP